MENDLISRSALIVVPHVCKVTEFDEAGFRMSYLAVPLSVINNAPTIDAVEVVRCKDCVHSIQTSEQDRKLWGLSNDHMECCWFGSNVLANDFCSYGKREKDAEVEG